MRNTHIDLLNVKVRLVTVSFFSCLSGNCLISVFWGFCVLFFLNKIFYWEIIICFFPIGLQY